MDLFEPLEDEDQAERTYTDITIILDSSGSMDSVLGDTIGGFNTFVRDQKKVSGNAKLSLITFSNHVQTIHKELDLNKVPDLDTDSYKPGGNTALLDAIGHAVDVKKERLKNLSNEKKPSQIVVVIITDGEENASVRHTKTQIKELIDEKTKDGWQFVFLGANQDAFHEAGNLGISGNATMTYNSNRAGVRAMYSCISTSLTSYRESGQNTGTSFFSNTDTKGKVK